MHISALAANIEYRRFIAVKHALFKGFVQVIEYHFVPYFYLCNELEKTCNILKTFVFGVFCKRGINFLMLVPFIGCGEP